MTSLQVRLPLAFFAIYVIWGSTFLAIRIAVLAAPPWFCAGVRFFIAGTLLFGFALLRGMGMPTLREWRSLGIIATLMFTMTYGALFWGEQYVPSGITSILESTLPLMTVVLEVFVLRQQKFRWSVVLAMTLGICGVALTMFKEPNRVSTYFLALSSSADRRAGLSARCCRDRSRFQNRAS